jgi:hypothetical protein
VAASASAAVKSGYQPSLVFEGYQQREELVHEAMTAWARTERRCEATIPMAQQSTASPLSRPLREVAAFADAGPERSCRPATGSTARSRLAALAR